MRNNTPLYDALRVFADSRPLRMCMPGHKGKPLPAPELSGWSTLDFTELPPTGDLFVPGGPIGEAEALWARVFGLPHCLFLTGGSTQGILTAITLACRPGDSLLLDRNSHRSAYNALSLLDLHPIFLYRAPLEDLPGPITANQIQSSLERHPEIKAVCITSPTYYGVLSDISALAETVHRYGGLLIVDAAHGAHLPFLGAADFSGADLVVTSAHKTLPAPGQSALLFAGDGFDPMEIRRAAALYGSSSPSYTMMAALDVCRAFLEGEGGDSYQAAIEQVARLREIFPALHTPPLDPGRLVIRAQDGFTVQNQLYTMGIYPEMTDRRHVVFICTGSDTPEDFRWLERALEMLPLGDPEKWEAPPIPERAIPPRQAYFAPRERVALHTAAGRIAACQIAPYPPGIPIVAPGEWITKKTVAYLCRSGYNMKQGTEVVQAGFSF